MNKLLLNGYKVKHHNSSNFFLIFHHKYPIGGLFADDKECNESFKKNKFSVIGSIDESFKINNNFHFLVEYPKLDAHLEWEQELPITSYTKDVYANVFNKSFLNFRGIAYSDKYNETCFDGTPNSEASWWYAFGIKNAFNGNIPGPIFQQNDQGHIQVNEALIWIKIDNVDNIRKLPAIRMKCTMKQQCSNRKLILMFMLISIN